MPLDVEVLIVSYNSATVMDSCLRSIAELLPGARVSVREHGDDLGALDRLSLAASRHDPPIHVDHDPTNPGFGAGCNALAKNSKAEWLLFLNPDAELVTWPWSTSGSTSGNTPASEPPRAIIGPMMTESGPPGDHYGTTYGIVDEVRRSWLRSRGRRPNGQGFVSGAALLIPAEVFRSIGGFDERYFMFYEDIDLCLRANAAGTRTIVEDDWRVRHQRGHSTKPLFGASLNWSYESACLFHAEHGSSVTIYRAYVVIDSVLRMALHLLRRNRSGRTGYANLARRSANDIISSKVRRPRS